MSAYTSHEVRDRIRAVLEPLMKAKQQAAYGLGNNPSPEEKADRAFYIGEASGVGIALAALADTFGFDNPGGPPRAELAEENPGLAQVQRSSNELAARRMASNQGRHVDRAAG